jgi:hypothetical protein
MRTAQDDSSNYVIRDGQVAALAEKIPALKRSINQNTFYVGLKAHFLGLKAKASTPRMFTHNYAQGALQRTLHKKR